MKGRRYRVVQGVLGVTGLVGLGLLAWSLAGQPWLRRGLWLVAGWQLFWYGVRAVLMVGIWRAETELSRGEKVWMALTVPIAVLFGVWCYRGKLSAYLAAEKVVAQ